MPLTWKFTPGMGFEGATTPCWSSMGPASVAASLKPPPPRGTIRDQSVLVLVKCGELNWSLL